MTVPQRKVSGFTIIEVMIVLAIAGLILAIVFLAIPNVQRSSRNTQRRDDASAALTIANEYATNNGGSLPTNYDFTPPTLTFGLATNAQSTTKLGYYNQAAMVTLQASYSAPAASATDTLTIMKGTKCTNSTTPAAGNVRQLAAVYGIETGSGYSWQCLES